ncbi:TIGR02679 domain-containing protein [Streptomyces sp. NPDC055089]
MPPRPCVRPCAHSPPSRFSLPAFAARVLGWAHALDDGTPLATLTLSGAPALTGFHDGQGAEWRREAWASVGLLRDELSSTGASEFRVAGPFRRCEHGLRRPRHLSGDAGPRLLTGRGAALVADQPTQRPDGEPRVSEDVAFARRMRKDFQRIEMEYEFAVDEVLTKVSILRREFLHLHRYNPIEHVGSRVKSTGSILRKVARLNIAPTPEAIRAGIQDIAGVRITCSFIADTYQVLEALISQDDVRVLQVKDYIAAPKPNGYKSLHALIEIPVFLSTGPVPVTVEVQIRTIAMDFWASLEHKIYYKYEGQVPPGLVASLTEAAHLAEQLDHRMEELHTEVRGGERMEDAAPDMEEQLLMRLWDSARSGDAPEGPQAG